MSHGLPDVTLQITRHKVILHSLREVWSEPEVILNDPSLTSMLLMVQNGMKCIAYIYYISIINLYFSRHGVLLNSKLNHIDLNSMSVNMTFTVQ